MQGRAEHRLACGDSAGAAAEFGEAMQLAAAAMSGASPRTQPELVALMAELRAGRKKAAALSAALAEVDWEHAQVFSAPPLAVVQPTAASGGGGGLDKLAGQLQAVLEARSPGRWQLQAALGTGSSGLVLQAADKLRREVAVKLVRPPPDASAWPMQAAAGGGPWCTPLAEEDGCFGGADAARLRREAKAMMRVDDPHVCSCYEYFFWPSEQQPRLFCMVNPRTVSPMFSTRHFPGPKHQLPARIFSKPGGAQVLQLVNGPTLEEELRRQGGRLGELEATRVVASLLRGLQAVHAAGLVHRDLKPANVALRHDDTAAAGGVRTSAEAGGLPRAVGCSLLDFGLARAAVGADGRGQHTNIAETLLELTQRGVAVGTPHYMAPEAWLAGGGGSAGAGAAGAAEEAGADGADEDKGSGGKDGGGSSPVADARADLWAVGVVLFRLLSGKLPFGKPIISHSVCVCVCVCV